MNKWLIYSQIYITDSEEVVMAKYIIGFMLVITMFTGCSISDEKEVETPSTTSISEDETTVENTQSSPKYIDLSSYFNSINGTAVFLTENSEEYIYNEDLSEKRYSPYSTFKIVSTLIGLDEGIISTKDSTMEYNGTIYWYDLWNDNLNLEQAFKNSCVWYYHQIINNIPEQTVQMHLEALNYGNEDISEWSGNESNPIEDLNGFWLGSSLEISPKEQVKLLKNIFEYKTDFSVEHITLLQELMKTEIDNVYGKTGSDSSNSWYVGYFVYNEKNIYFATFIQGDDVSGSKAKDISISIIENWSNISSDAS